MAERKQLKILPSCGADLKSPAPKYRQLYQSLATLKVASQSSGNSPAKPLGVTAERISDLKQWGWSSLPPWGSFTMYFCVGVGLAGARMRRFESDGNLHKRPFPDCPPISPSWRFHASGSYPHASGQHEHAPRLRLAGRQGLKHELGRRSELLPSYAGDDKTGNSDSGRNSGSYEVRIRDRAIRAPYPRQVSGAVRTLSGAEGGRGPGSLPIRCLINNYTGIHRSLYMATRHLLGTLTCLGSETGCGTARTPRHNVRNG
jgi:hypothetical protein